jgi:hypothetical protein
LLQSYKHRYYAYLSDIELIPDPKTFGVFNDNDSDYAIGGYDTTKYPEVDFEKGIWPTIKPVIPVNKWIGQGPPSVKPDKIEINDSCFVYYANNNGVHAEAINSLKVVNKKHFAFSLWLPDSSKKIIHIYIVDPKMQIAIFEDESKQGAYRYTLMASADKIKNFPLIVNNCITSKMPIAPFDKLDYKKLIQKSKRSK